MLSAFPRERKNLETNSGPGSDVNCSGTPCLENTWLMKIMARSSEVQCIVVGMKMLCLESRSTPTGIESQPEEVGSVSMKSMEIEFQGRSGIGSCLSSP